MSFCTDVLQKIFKITVCVFLVKTVELEYPEEAWTPDVSLVEQEHHIQKAWSHNADVQV